jgi:hypothetical protein
MDGWMVGFWLVGFWLVFGWLIRRRFRYLVG